jgi:membrane associated rhomboid family serine protease
MRQAAVGFQCPSCVREGARTTRAGRTAYGGLRSGRPALTSQVLIGINVAVWVLIMVTGGSASVWVERLALLVRGVCASASGSGYFPGATQASCALVPGAHWFPGVADGAYWQLVTSIFTHVEFWHIGFNMVALWFLGPQLEMILGRARFLAVYFISGLAGSAAVYWLAGPHSSTLGASGALFGLMGALLVIAIKVHGNVSQIGMWIGLNFLFTVLGRGFISWQGHLGGFIGGVLVALLITYVPRARRAQLQWAGIALLAAVIVVAIAARTVILG